MLYCLLYFIILISNISLTSEISTPDLTCKTNKLQEHGFRWKETLDLQYYNTSIPCNISHTSALNKLEKAKLSFNNFAKGRSTFNKNSTAIDNIQNKNWAFGIINVIGSDANNNIKSLTISIVDILDNKYFESTDKELFFLSGKKGDELTKKIISEYNNWCFANSDNYYLVEQAFLSRKNLLFETLEKMIILPAEIKDVINNLYKTPPIDLGNITTYISNIKSRKAILKNHKTINNKNTFIRKHESILESITEIIDKIQQTSSLHSTSAGIIILNKIKEIIVIIKNYKKALEEYINEYQKIEIKDWYSPEITNSNLQIKALVKTFQGLNISVQKQMRYLSSIFIDPSLGEVAKTISTSTALILNMLPNEESKKYTRLDYYIDVIRKELDQYKSRLLDSEQWFRLLLFINAEKLWKVLEDRLNEKFKNYFLMAINFANYYDMCSRCTATWALESILGNNHDPAINEITKEFSFFSKFNSIRRANNQNMINFVVLGSSIENTTEDAIRRYEQGHDGYHNSPIEIPQFLPLIAFRMPIARITRALPQYKDSESMKRLYPNYWPNFV